MSKGTVWLAAIGIHGGDNPTPKVVGGGAGGGSCRQQHLHFGQPDLGEAELQCFKSLPLCHNASEDTNTNGRSRGQ